jgi:hypothetical protein
LGLIWDIGRVFSVNFNWLAFTPPPSSRLIRSFSLPFGPIISGLETYSKCISGFFAIVACNMVDKCSYASAQLPYMSFSACCFARHALTYFTRYPHATITTSINTTIVINGQFLMILTSLCEMNLEDSWPCFLSYTFVKQV